MRLKNLNFDSSQDYLYLERYVNCGSPSGFTDKYNTSAETCAKSPNSSFYLYSIELPQSIISYDYGKMPSFFNKWQIIPLPNV